MNSGRSSPPRPTKRSPSLVSSILGTVSVPSSLVIASAKVGNMPVKGHEPMRKAFTTLSGLVAALAVAPVASAFWSSELLGIL
ncbi:hypothetical protein F5Y01DRAFT_213733 [Xylaria sp. FL0043]|nr:hypothetical protein F5Y01DRAFT_213733 [Xylaria sp. FL0043]